MSGQAVTIVDERDRVLGSSTGTPLYVQQVGGGGGGTATSVTNYPGAGAAALEASTVPLAVPAGAALSTLAASATRAGYWFFQNQSTNLLTVVLDDGNGNAVSVTTWAGAPNAGGQGGTTGSQDTGPHLGRIRVYGPANSSHSLRAQ